MRHFIVTLGVALVGFMLLVLATHGLLTGTMRPNEIEMCYRLGMVVLFVCAPIFALMESHAMRKDREAWERRAKWERF